MALGVVIIALSTFFSPGICVVTGTLFVALAEVLEYFKAIEQAKREVKDKTMEQRISDLETVIKGLTTKMGMFNAFD